MPAQLVQLDLVSQGSAEGAQSLLGIILASIKAPVDERLDAPSDWLKEGGNRQCRDD
jgi:hypothetical protein